jgi:hypothetical protein
MFILTDHVLFFVYRKIVQKANWTRKNLLKFINNFIQLVKQINFVLMFLKHSTLIIQEKSVGLLTIYPSNKYLSLDFVEFLIAISVTSHGDIREKLNMAFNMYGKCLTISMDYFR